MGSVCPSSKTLAEEVTQFVAREEGAQVVLEVGAGNGGNITEAIITKLRPQDRFDIVEIDPEFCAELHRKYDHIPQVHIYCTSITTWRPPYAYDTIVATVPLHVLPFDLMQSILESYKMLSKNGGMVSFIQYWGQALLHLTPSQSVRDRLSYKMTYTRHFRERYFHRSDFVLLNVPPTYVHHLKITK